jgi:hypothetical protein
MKDFVYAPGVLFYSLSFMYQNAFFIGTKYALYVCPEDKDKDAQTATGTVSNFIEGKKSDIFLMNLVQQPDTNAKVIHDVFSHAIRANNETGYNNIACVDFLSAKRIRFNSNWFETSIAIGYKENLMSEKFMVGGFGKAYKKDFVNFYLQFYKPNKMLKSEENFK